MPSNDSIGPAASPEQAPRRAIAGSVSAGDVAGLVACIEMIPPHDRTYYLDAALATAVAADAVQCIDVLIEEGADVNAACPVHPSRAIFMVDEYATPSQGAIRTGTLLHHCAFHGILAAGERLIGAGAAINAGRVARRESALHLAIESGRVEFAHLLLRHGARAGTADVNGATPLHAAHAVGDPTIISGLLAAGASLEATDEHGATPLMSACAAQRPLIVAELLRHGADAGATDHEGWTALHLIGTEVVQTGPGTDSLEDARACVASLTAAGLAVDTRDGEGCTPLHLAVDRSNEALSVALLELGADPLARTPDGDTAVDLARDTLLAERLNAAARSSRLHQERPMHPPCADPSPTL